MRVVNDFPPNIEEVREQFPLTGNELFAWGDIIYNPGGGRIPQQLIDHEKVHQLQQGDDVEGWWEKYLIDIEFRFKQELEAHKEEYRSFCRVTKDRNKQARYLIVIARRLASPMYGKMIKPLEAVRRIKG